MTALYVQAISALMVGALDCTDVHVSHAMDKFVCKPMLVSRTMA